MMEDEKIIVEFTAKIEVVKYYSDDTNYHVMQFSTDKKLPNLKSHAGRYIGTLVGTCIKCIEGDTCNVKAEGISHPTFGFQYKILSLDYDRPTDSNSMYTFLSAILSEAQTNILYNAYPDIVDRVLADNNYVPDLRNLKGIGEKTWYRIRDKIVDNLGYTELITLLSPVGCTLHMIKQIGKGEKNLSLLKQRILDNPYILCEIPRMGFKKVDKFAIKLNPDIEFSEHRVYSCIDYILKDIANNDGHCFMPIKELKKAFKELIIEKEIMPVFEEVIAYEREKTKNNQNPILWIDDENVGSVMFRRMEQFILNKFIDIQNTYNVWELSYESFFNSMQETTKQQGFYLSNEQAEAVRSIAEKNITVISGKAGCVDCDTEYFNGIEWVRIADYKEGDKVLSYNIDTKEAFLDYPSVYIKEKCNYMWHFHDNSTDQVLCDEHNILIWNGEKIKVKEWLKDKKSLIIPSHFYTKLPYFHNIKIQHMIDKNCNVSQYKTKDGYKYCFTMPLGTLILRRNNKIFITGNCGKTSIIKAILEVYKDKRIGMAALSAKAAKRMREVTGFQSACTIHRLLGFQGINFLYNEDVKLPYDLLILDECSMNNIFLFHAILKATRDNTKIVMAGDFCQLPPIGVGNVFFDIVKNPIFNNHLLTQVYRQSDTSFINEHANVVREGIMPFDIINGTMPFGKDILYVFRNKSEDILENAVNLYLEALNRMKVDEVTIVTPRKDTVCISCETLNNEIQKRLLKDETRFIEHNNKIFKVGTRIINKKNNYEKGILNGELGTVIFADSKDMTVQFDEGPVVQFKKTELEDIELGYAISVHSSQGSQYKITIVAMDMSSYTLLTSNMIYTAMTRASDSLIIMSQPSAFSFAVTNVQEHYRNTYLKLLLSEVDKENMNNKVKIYAKDHPCVYKKSINTLSLHDDEDEIIVNNFTDAWDDSPF